MPFISSFQITNVVVPEPLYIFFCIPASLVEVAGVRTNKPRGFMTDFDNGNPVIDQDVCLKIIQFELFSIFEL